MKQISKNYAAVHPGGSGGHASRSRSTGEILATILRFERFGIDVSDGVLTGRIP
jgi:hypothetical protein